MDKYTEYANHISASEEVLEWIETVLKNYCKKNETTTEEVEHILDYLVSSEAPRLSRLSYTDAKKKADDWTKKLQAQAAEIQESEEDTEEVLGFADGFKIVKLVGKNAYEREGYLMRHCVADYYGRDAVIYSLRDANNKPHCTMEHDQQIKGKGNGDIHPKYIKYIKEFLEYIGMTVEDYEMRHLGYKSTTLKDYIENTLFQDRYLPKDEELIPREGVKIVTSLDELEVALRDG